MTSQGVGVSGQAPQQQHSSGGRKATTNVLQINLHHSVAATTELSKRTEHMETFVALVQEPWIVKGGIRGLSKRGLHSYGGPKPRACILASPNLRLWELPQFSDRDCMAVNIKWRDTEAILASVYMADDGSPLPSQAVVALVAHCENKGLPLIIGCDSNAHHLMWGSTDVNARGASLVEFLEGTDLCLCNKGHEPTFVTAIMKQVLDLTLVSSNWLHKIKHWRVDKGLSFSDHKYVMFIIDSEPVDPIFYRNRRKTQWDVFHWEVKGALPRDATEEITSVEEIDKVAYELGGVLRSAFHAACPQRRVKAQGPHKSYWTEELSLLRKVARRADHKHVDSGYSFSTLVELKEARRAYQKALRAAKRDSWKAFTEGVESYSGTARLHKTLTNSHIREIGPVQKPDGTYTSGVEETLDHLMSVHYPADPQRHSLTEADHTAWPSQEVDDIVNHQTVKRAISTFGPFKAAGTDEVFPAMLKNGPKVLISHLVRLMKACLMYGHMPRAWREMRVIFLPKPGRDSYTRPSSWRPISLTSFLLKLLERLIDWHIRTPLLVESLVESGQCAYLREVNTELALHRLVSVAEGALRAREIAVGVFLDIEGAFSHATFRSFIGALRGKGVSEVCVRFIGNMLETRSVISTLQGVTRYRVVERGCPQGGVLSPLLWIVLVDEVLLRLKRALPQMVAPTFADDLGLIQLGPDIGTVLSLCQQGINIISKWCDEVDLAVLADKTQAIIFTRKKLPNLKPLLVKGQAVKFVDHARYLGIFLDSKLTWLKQCQVVGQKCSIALAQCKRAIGKTWGLKPRIAHWLYTAVIRPALCYGVMVWIGAVYKSNTLALLERVQRLGLLSICGTMRSTPTAAMECLLDLTPIDTYLEAMATRAMNRLRKSGHWKDQTGYGVRALKLVPHSELCGGLAREVPEMEMPSDHRKQLLPLSRFTANIKTRKEWEESGSPRASRAISCFTDGSKLDGKAGAAYHIPLYAGEKIEGCFPLGKHPDIYQAELVAVLEAATYLRQKEVPCEAANFYVDSSSVIKSMTSHWPQPGLVRDCHGALNELAEKMEVNLHWIPAHREYSGNERADVSAKKATKLPFIGPEPVIPVNTHVIERAIMDWSRKRHCSKWQALQTCGQSKRILKGPSKAEGAYCRRLSRNQLRILAQVVTGHSVLALHLHRLGMVADPFCPLCKEEEEDRDHFLCRCETLARVRKRVFGNHPVDPEDLINTPLSTILEFAERSLRFSRRPEGRPNSLN
jgi:ribonuclease HI